MRALALAAGLLVAITAVPLGSALLPTPCTDANSTISINFSWTPGCLRIVSGDIITFDNADLAPHNARSSQDTMVAIPGVAPCFATPNIGDGRIAQVRFTHDSDGVKASLRNANGSWGAPVDCTLAEEPTTIASSEAGIPFECGIHSSMTGRIVVAQVG